MVALKLEQNAPYPSWPFQVNSSSKTLGFHSNIHKPCAYLRHHDIIPFKESLARQVYNLVNDLRHDFTGVVLMPGGILPLRLIYQHQIQVVKAAMKAAPPHTCLLVVVEHSLLNLLDPFCILAFQRGPC